MQLGDCACEDPLTGTPGSSTASHHHGWLLLLLLEDSGWEAGVVDTPGSGVSDAYWGALCGHWHPGSHPSQSHALLL